MYLTAARHATAVVSAFPIAAMAHNSGLEIAAAATLGILLPAIHGGIDLVVHGPDLAPKQIGLISCGHLAGLWTLWTALDFTLTP